jgi:predicted RNase H-like HicB family nuclease
VLTPDLEVGGFTIEVPELPGLVTEADTLSEARVMVADAVVLWLDAVGRSRKARGAR